MANLVDIRSWNEGVGSIGDFSQISSDSFNLRSVKADPWNNNTVVWSSISGKSTGVSGGFTIRKNINSSTQYRFSTWFYKNQTANVKLMMGIDQYDISETPIGSTSYCFNYVIGDADAWFLHVGFIFPHDHVLSGFPETKAYYSNGSLYNYGTDIRWEESCVTAKLGIWMYNNTTTSNYVQTYAYPRFEICDGTEPTIEQLLRGAKYTRIMKTNTGTFAINTRRL